MKKVDWCVLGALLLLFSLSLVVFILQTGIQARFEEMEEVQSSLSRVWKGVNYEVTIREKEDPIRFCLQGEGDIKIVATDYFYIVQGESLIHGIAVDNSRFEINQHLSGCWSIEREKDSLLIRVVNISGGDVTLTMGDSVLESSQSELRSAIETMSIFSLWLFFAILIVLSVYLAIIFDI